MTKLDHYFWSSIDAKTSYSVVPLKCIHASVSLIVGAIFYRCARKLSNKGIFGIQLGLEREQRIKCQVLITQNIKLTSVCTSLISSDC